MRVHGILEFIAGVLSIVAAFVCLIVFFITKIGLLWISIAGAVVGGVIVIVIAKTFMNDADRLDDLENRVEYLEGDIKNMHQDNQVNKHENPQKEAFKAYLNSNAPKSGSKECPKCHAILNIADTECFNCGEKLDSKLKPVRKQSDDKGSDLLLDEIRCKNCGTINKNYRTNCYACNAPLK